MQRVFEEITSYVCVARIHRVQEKRRDITEQLFSLYVMLMFGELCL